MPHNFDLIILGAGPAGMSAARRACALGLDVGVVDEQPAPGGQVWRNVEHATARRSAEAFGSDYESGAALARAFRACGATYLPGTQVWEIEPGFRVYTRNADRLDILFSRTLLIATGAVERAVPFPGWTLPGVMTVGAAQILMKSADDIPDRPVWIAGSGPLPLLYAQQLLESGGAIAGILDTAPRTNRYEALPHAMKALACWDELLEGARWIRRLRRSAIAVIRGVTEIEAFGASKVDGIRYHTDAGNESTVPATLLLVHEGVVPDIHMTLALGCRHEWNDAQQCFVPTSNEWGETSERGAYVAGDGSGIGGVRAACAAGEIAALAIARALGRLTEADTQQGACEPRRLRTRALALRPFLDALYRPRPQLAQPADDTIVCRCEHVTAGAIRAAVRGAAGEPNQVKAATRCGMGPCMGRLCGLTVAHLIAGTSGRSVAETGLYRVRPPLRPITLAQLASLEGKEIAA